jgi:L-phenylalanine/L-methionine N-acetyltransferase
MDGARLPHLEGVTLRRARPDDAEDFAAMMNDPLVYPGVMQLPYTDAAFHRERLAANVGGPGQVDLQLLAVHDGRVIGGAGLHAAGTHVRRRHVMYLGITVAGPWQGRGVGGLLMAALCEHADRWLGVLRLELTVYTDNLAAIALYRRYGFEIEGTHRAYVLRDGRFVDAHAMARLHPNPPGWNLAG